MAVAPMVSFVPVCEYGSGAGDYMSGEARCTVVSFVLSRLGEYYE